MTKKNEKKDIKDEMGVFINPEFLLSEIVYLKTDVLQNPRIVIAYYIEEGGVISYDVRFLDETNRVFGFELTNVKNLDLINEYKDV